MKHVLIIGATSAIAHACARRWAAQGHVLFLVARDEEKLAANAADLEVRGAAAVHVFQLDVLDTSRHADMLAAAQAALPVIDIVLLAHGTLPDQARCEQDAEAALHEFNLNAGTVIALLTRLAPLLEAQKRGSLAVISSVAGDRGRASNYLYGSAKAAISTFCAGLQHRLWRSGVQVLTIKPGFVDTPMTAGLPLPTALLATPEQVAAPIVRAIGGRRSVLYVPWFWQFIMLIIRLLPRAIFQRTRL